MAETPRRGPAAGDRRLDPVALIAGVVTLLLAAYVYTDGAIVPADIDPRWLLAGGAIAVGLGMLLTSMRSGSR
ncbi:hypothetical protein [Haloechinothrix sp. LS1_15]|uniref:hypothetical protein n=1 Tax=Haloechinothrix sp. LS1_15 TaxID=2652248 RepID=UPI0029454AC5|nr:hypothetical protein [Haloechinothrix sp. LS1_15]MDV6013046.1 hypothetical protein [Haloechinothrix sp. LS1_15]